MIAFAVLNIAGLATAVLTGAWRLRQMYDVAYFPDRHYDLGDGSSGTAAAGEAVHAGRGPRTPLLLRFCLGGLHRSAHPVGALEGAAPCPLG